VTTYYPDAVDLAAAIPIELSSGSQARGLEIRLQKVPVFKISGNLVNEITGEAGSADSLNLIRQGSGPPGLRTRSTGVKAGEFSFDEVLPGAYVIEAKSTGETGDQTPLIGRQIISVGNGDLDRVLVEMKPGIEVRGKISVEGSPVSSWPQVTLTATEGLNNPDFATIDVDGRFALTGLEPAPYRIEIGSLSPPTFVKSVRFNGQDIVDALIDLASTPTASLELVISDRVSSLTGVASDSGGGPVGPAIVVMARRRGTASRPRITKPDEKGRFSFAGLPAGEYRVTALERLIVQLDLPDFFERFGTAVTVGEDVPATMDLWLTTMGDFASPIQ